MNTLKRLFSRQWWWVTLIVLLGMTFLVRLGVWQLDRLQQRRDFNEMVYTRWTQEPFDLGAEELPTDLGELEYRRVQAVGEFDYGNQIALKNQQRAGQPGVGLVTPLVLDDGRAVLVARGWIPQADADPAAWGKYDEPAGAPVVSIIQESQLMPFDKPVPIPDAPQQEVFYVNIDAIQPQMPYELLPFFLLQLPEEGRMFDMLPYREEPIRLTEGDHLSYALQWFTFALILGFGYIQFVRLQERRAARIKQEEAKHRESQASEAADPSGVSTSA